MNKLLIMSILMVSTGCTTISKSNLYWGNYSTTLYNYKKTPSDETLKLHKQEIANVLDYSQKMGLKMPPGLQAEFGLYELESGNAKQAETYFLAEQASYPESVILINMARSGTERLKK